MSIRWLPLIAAALAGCAQTPARPSAPHPAPAALSREVPAPSPAAGPEAAPAAVEAGSELEAAAPVGDPASGALAFELADAAQPWSAAPVRQTSTRAASKPTWHVGQALAQGWLGVASYKTAGRSGGSVPVPPDGAVDEGTLPTIGGGGMWKLAGKGIDFGLEGGIAFSFRSSGGFFVTGSNGAVIGVTISSLVFDLYGGAFVSKFLGDRARIYLAGGPLLQWADYDQDSETSDYAGSGSGFGGGWYLRTGLEFLVGHETMVGLAGRWIDTTIDLSGGLGDYDLEGAQLLFTVTRSL